MSNFLLRVSGSNHFYPILDVDGIEYNNLFFGLINNSDYNLSVLSFNNFDLETVNSITRYKIIENELSPSSIFTNILNSAYVK